LRFKGPFDSETACSDSVADAGVVDVDFLDLALDRVYFVRVRGITTVGGHRSTFDIIKRAVASATP